MQSLGAGAKRAIGILIAMIVLTTSELFMEVAVSWRFASRLPCALF